MNRPQDVKLKLALENLRFAEENAEAALELALWKGRAVSWTHGDHMQSGHVVEHGLGGLHTRRVLVLKPSGKKQWINYDRIVREL